MCKVVLSQFSLRFINQGIGYDNDKNNMPMKVRLYWLNLFRLVLQILSNIFCNFFGSLIIEQLKCP